ncbi:DUF2461 domain-containing protein [Bacteroidia bacterium]|nr:DUF2461 domain-containing protein [Bacteroidia bacterium]
MITKETFSFIKNLAANNNRDWFAENRKSYDEARGEVLNLLTEIQGELNIADKIEEAKIYRINRDVRFSKDKSPYKMCFSGYYKRAGAARRGSYYFSIQPGGQTIVGGGFYGPNKDDLLRIRKEFEMDTSEIEKITSNQNFITHFGSLQGGGVKSAPRDFNKEHPNIKWIRMKQFYAFRSFTDKEVLDPSFCKEMMSTFMAIRPFFDYMSDVLTTNINGESLL